MDWFAVDPKTNELKKAFSLIGYFTSQLTASIKDLKIVPQLGFIKQEFKLKSTEIGEFTTEPLNSLLNFAFDKGIVPFINNRAKDGFPIPAIPDVKLINPEISFQEKYLVVSTDVNYVGVKKEEHSK